jgi:hypothetical protein
MNDLIFFVTGTFHGSHVYATSEGAARRAFHAKYLGESIIGVRFIAFKKGRSYIKQA